MEGYDLREFFLSRGVDILPFYTKILGACPIVFFSLWEYGMSVGIWSSSDQLSIIIIIIIIIYRVA